MKFDFVEVTEKLADIKVVGIGGAGGNAVNRMVDAGLAGVEFHAVNTDLQALRESHAHNPLQIGAQLTRGLGSGGNPEVGRSAAEEDREALVAALQGADMVFVTAGMGGGTGTGGAPIIAGIARDLGALTVAVVTKPFEFESRIRMQQAEEGIAALQEAVDTLLIIPNQRLLDVMPPSASLPEAFRFADNVLYEATRGIYEIISRPNQVNLDFADVRSVMQGMGVALMGTGRASGEDRAATAAREAISSPLLEEVDIRGARGVLVNILGGEVGLAETSSAMRLVQEAVGEQAHVIFGYGIDESLGDMLQVTVIATGFASESSVTVSRAAAAATVATMEAATLPEAVEELAVAEVVEEEFTPTELVAPAATVALPFHTVDGPAASDETAIGPATLFEPTVADPSAPSEPAATVQSLPEVPDEPVEADSEIAYQAMAAQAGGTPRVQVPLVAAADEVQDGGGGHSPTVSVFLRPVDADDLSKLEPEQFDQPAERETPRSAFRSDTLVDLNAPAYTRKYMD